MSVTKGKVLQILPGVGSNSERSRINIERKNKITIPGKKEQTQFSELVTRALSISDRKEKAFGEKLACRDFTLAPRKPQQQLSVRARGIKDDYSASRTIPSNLSDLSPFSTCENPETMFSCSRFSYEKKLLTFPGSGNSW